MYYLDKHEIDVYPLDKHPCEGGEEEVVQKSCYCRAQLGVGGGVEAGNGQDLGKEQADAQLPVDRRPVASNSCKVI